MGFLKKNFFKMLSVFVTTVGAAIMLVILIRFDAINYGVERNEILGVAAGEDHFNALGVLFGYIALFTFFVLVTAVLIMSMFNATKKYDKWVVLGAGVLGTTFMLLAMLLPIRSDSYALVQDIRNGDKNVRIQTFVQEQVVRGAMLTQSRPPICPVCGFQGEHGESLRVFISMPLGDWAEFIEQHVTCEDQAADILELKSEIKAHSAVAIQQAKDNAQYQFSLNLFLLAAQLVLLGNLPMIYGLKMIFSKEE